MRAVSPVLSSADARKAAALAAMFVAAALLVGVYAWRTAPPPLTSATLPGAPPSIDLRDAAASSAVAWRPRFFVRHTAIDQTYGRLSLDDGRGAADSRRATDLSCEAVFFAAGRGICLEAKRGALTTYWATLFDTRVHVTSRTQLDGFPSRARISPDGKYAAFTVFVTGHAYDNSKFSTHTGIVDAASGAPVVANLEQMTVWKGGTPLRSTDFNFWGVTFTNDSNQFYATLGTGGVAYLVKGDIAGRRLEVVTSGVECPSLSPDGTRIGFKKRVPGGGLVRWRLYVLDLATLKEHPTSETRFIDEQVVWLDNAQIMYTQANPNSPADSQVWVTRADGMGSPEMLLAHASTPALTGLSAVIPRR
jgi:hypothetical protein